MTARQDKMRQYLREIAAEFYNREAGPHSLITVTDVTISPDLKYSTIYITTLPASEETRALLFAKRKRTELREYVASKTRLRALPLFEVKLDMGERMRQRIDDISNQE